jgi:hypothetical protein
MASQPPTDPHPEGQGPLATGLITLAGTPDHVPDVGAQLVAIAKLAADRIGAATYASVTALTGRVHVTVAVSDELVRAVDEAQYIDSAGPCIEALHTGTPVGVPDIAATLQWPHFHEEAPRLGLHASVSVPLYAGRGEPIAALNLYGHESATMAPLIAGICAVHEHGDGAIAAPDDLQLLDEGGWELVTGYAEALSIRATIRLSLSIIMKGLHCGADDAYLALCIRAGEAGTDLARAADLLLTRGI